MATKALDDGEEHHAWARISTGKISLTVK